MGMAWTMMWSADKPLVLVAPPTDTAAVEVVRWGCVMKNAVELLGVHCCSTSNAWNPSMSSPPSTPVKPVQRVQVKAVAAESVF